jgi:hypothetical protein
MDDLCVFCGDIFVECKQKIWRPRENICTFVSDGDNCKSSVRNRHMETFIHFMLEVYLSQ